MSLPTPYYEHDGIVIYHGDCRDILPHLPICDLLLTDPPYGIGEAAGKNKSRGLLAVSVDYGVADWDDKPITDDLLYLALGVANRSIIFGGNYYAHALKDGPGWLVWNKENGMTDFADCELAWTNLPQAVRIKHHQWHGMIRKGGELRYHPTAKPVAVMAWCIEQADKHGTNNTILDPFMGSGTTLRAAKDLGRQCIGIEIEEKYCEIAARRLGQEVLPL